MTRSVTVVLRANNSQYDASMVESGRKTKVLEEATKRAGSSAALQSKAFTTAGRSVVAAGALMEGAFVGAARSAMNFNAAMSQVQTLSHATAAEMGYLRTAAEHAGTAIGFSATQTADAETELIKAGVSVADIMGGALRGSLTLAAAGQIDVAKATEIATIAMTQFKLSGADVPHVADLLSAGADKALGGVDSLGEALKSGGLVAAQFGVSLDDTIGTLAAFANAGLMGESAGTDMRQMLLKLAAPSVESAQTMQDLGVQVYNAGGKFIGFTALAGQLRDKLSGLTQQQRDHALAVIFGARAIVGANILYANGAKGIDDWNHKVNDGGFAMQQAAGKMDNLKGDLRKLGAAFQTDLIDSGNTANGVLRDGAKFATGALNAYGALPHAVQGAATGLAGIGGAAALTAGAFMLAVPKVAAFKTSLEDMGPRTARFGKAVLGAGDVLAGPWGLALAGGVVALGLYGHAKAQAAAEVAQFTQAILADSGAIGENTRRTAVAALEKRGLLADADRLGISLKDVTDAALGNSDAIGRVNQALAANQATFAGSARDVNVYGDVVAARAGDLNTFRDHLHDVTSATEGGVAAAKRQQEALGATSAAGAAAAGTQSALGTSVAGTTAAIGGQVVKLKDLLDSYQAVTDHVLGLRDANRSYEAAIDAAGKSLQTNGQGLSVFTEKGRANSAALDDVAKAANAVLKNLVDNGAQLPRVTAAFHVQHDELVRLAERFGMTKKQAEAYASSVVKIPPTVKTKVSVTGVMRANADLDSVTRHAKAASTPVVIAVSMQGMAAVNKALTDLTSKSRSVGATIQGPGTNLLTGPIGATPVHPASGGFITGPGTATSDSIPAMLSNGEFVVNSAQTSKHLGLLRAINAGVQGFASGGLVIPPAARFNPSTSLSSQALAMARRGRSADDIQGLVAAYDDYIQRLQQAAQREKLLADIHDAQVAKGKASATDRAAAQQHLNDAVKALRDFDQAAVVDREKAATDRLITSLQKQADARQRLYQMQDNAYAVGQRSAKDEIASLTKRMAAEVKFSDAWTALYQQRKQILDDVAQASKDAADAAQEAADRARQSLADQLGSLNQMLDQAASIHAQLAQSSATYADKQQQLADRERQVELTFQSGMLRAQQDYADAEGRILHARQDTLTGWASLTERASVTWGNTLGQLQGNVTDQITKFQEWMDGLADARSSGVSEAVISALGLDQGPQALGQLRQFSTATQAQIDALNAAVAQRTALAGQEVHREQVAGYGQMGADLAAAQAQYQQTVLGLQEQYRTDQASIAADMQQAQQTFMTEQNDLTAQLAQIGTDQGRSYADAVAAGIASGLPGILAQVAAVRAAMAQVTGAQSSTTTAPTPAAGAPSGGSVFLGGSPLPPETATNDRLISSMRESDWTDRQRAYADMYGLSGTSVFDTGGWLQPGYTLAYNGTGQPERIRTPAQESALNQPQAVNVKVFVGDREITDIVRVEMDSTLGARRSTAEIAGAR